MATTTHTKDFDETVKEWNWEPRIPDVKETLVQIVPFFGGTGEILENGPPFYPGMKLDPPSFTLVTNGIPIVAIRPNSNEDFFDLTFNRVDQNLWHTERLVPYCLLTSAVLSGIKENY